MLNSIVEKLRVLLAQPIDDEYKALYFMAQLRKLGELEGRLTSSLTLWMNWTLHTKLHAPSSTFVLMKEIDDFIHELCSGNVQLGPTNLTFQELKKDLRERLLSYGLPVKICDDPKSWSQFMTVFSSIIEDCELTINSSISDDLKYVTHVTFTKGEALSMGDFPFTMNWKVLLKNCKFKEVSLSPHPNEVVHDFTVWSYQVVNA